MTCRLYCRCIHRRKELPGHSLAYIADTQRAYPVCGLCYKETLKYHVIFSVKSKRGNKDID